jgi:hypothetical protein
LCRTDVVNRVDWAKLLSKISVSEFSNAFGFGEKERLKKELFLNLLLKPESNSKNGDMTRTFLFFYLYELQMMQFADGK